MQLFDVCDPIDDALSPCVFVCSEATVIFHCSLAVRRIYSRLCYLVLFKCDWLTYSNVAYRCPLGLYKRHF